MTENNEVGVSLSPEIRQIRNEWHQKETQYFDSEEKGIYYLLVSNGAGFAGTLSTLKDYATVPQLKGIGVLISIFGIGFTFAVVAYMLMSVARNEVLNFVGYGGKKPTTTAIRMSMITGLFSACLLVGAVLEICRRLSNL